MCGAHSRATRSGSFLEVEILLGQQHAGRVYAHGFFVAKADLPLAGINYLGSGEYLGHVGIGRDRNSVQIERLIHRVPVRLCQGTIEAILHAVGTAKHSHAAACTQTHMCRAGPPATTTIHASLCVAACGGGPFK